MIVRPELSIIEGSVIPDSVRIMPFTNIYGSVLGEFVFVAPFVELGGCHIGNFTKISSHSYICPGVSIGNHCFIAHSVCFSNDAFTDPDEYTSIDELSKGWKQLKTKVGDCVRIGSGAIILPGITVGDNSVIGAGAVVTKDVPPSTIVAGVPARVVRRINEWQW